MDFAFARSLRALVNSFLSGFVLYFDQKKKKKCLKIFSARI